MKQIIIGVVLAILLVGCGEKPQFSINKSDTPETYANNPVFTKIKAYSIFRGIEDKDDKEEAFGYQFIVAPVSVNGIETGDLNVIGGTIIPPSAGQKDTNITMTMKGKESFDKLEKRLSELKELTCSNFGVGNSRMINCYVVQQGGSVRVMLSSNYNPFSDISSFMYLKHLN